jgi:hypothetical protein
MWIRKAFAVHPIPHYSSAMGRAAVEHLGAYGGPLPDCSKPAETSHKLANQISHGHRPLGRYSPQPSWGFPSRP